MSAHNFRTDCQRRTLVPPFAAVLMQLPYQCRQCQCNVTTVQALLVAVVALKQSAIECYTLYVSCGMTGVTLRYCYSGDYPTQGISELCFLGKNSLDAWVCLGLNPLDMPRTPYWASDGNHSHIPGYDLKNFNSITSINFNMPDICQAMPDS